MSEGEEQPTGSAQTEEEETCGFCIFMKGGGCKDAFEEWSKCVDAERETDNDFTETCREATIKLRECMLKNREYYAPLLEEEEREAREREQKVETNQEPGEGSESPHPNSPEGTEH